MIFLVKIFELKLNFCRTCRDSTVVAPSSGVVLQFLPLTGTMESSMNVSWSSPPSLTTVKLSHCSSMNTILGESSEFPMSSISIPSSPSSITTFFLKGCLLQLKHKFFENKTRKIRNKSISARVVSSISFHIYLFPFVSFSSIEKILTEVN